MYGIAYRVTLDGIDYVWKRQKILPSNRKKNFHSYVWRELDFYRWIGRQPKKTREFFAPLHAYRIVRCDYKHTRPMEGRNPLYPKLDASKYCLDQLLTDRGLGVKQAKVRWTPALLRSYLLQVSTAIDLMNSVGYRHGDLHAGNVAIEKTDLKTLKLFGREVPTAGYRFRLIDYGEVLHRKFPVSKENEYRDRRMKRDAEKEMFGEWRRWLTVELFDYSKLQKETKNRQRRNRYTTLHYNLAESLYEHHRSVFEQIKRKILRKLPKQKEKMELFISDFDARSPGIGRLRTLFFNLLTLHYPAIWRQRFKGFTRPKPRFSNRKIEELILAESRRELRRVLKSW